MKKEYLIGLILIISAISLSPVLAEEIIIDVYIDNNTVDLTYGNVSATYSSLLNNSHNKFNISSATNASFLSSGCLDDIQWYLEELKGRINADLRNEILPNANELSDCQSNLSISLAKSESHNELIKAKDERIEALQDSIEAKDTENTLLMIFSGIMALAVVLTIVGQSGLLNKFIKGKKREK